MYVAGLWICAVGGQLCAVVSVGDEEKMVETGCQNSAQGPFLWARGLEGLLSLALVGS